MASSSRSNCRRRETRRPIDYAHHVLDAGIGNDAAGEKDITSSGLTSVGSFLSTEKETLGRTGPHGGGTGPTDDEVQELVDRRDGRFCRRADRRQTPLGGNLTVQTSRARRRRRSCSIPRTDQRSVFHRTFSALRKSQSRTAPLPYRLRRSLPRVAICHSVSKYFSSVPKEQRCTPICYGPWRRPDMRTY
jgi:hypothetical protein